MHKWQFRCSNCARTANSATAICRPTAQTQGSVPTNAPIAPTASRPCCTTSALPAAAISCRARSGRPGPGGKANSSGSATIPPPPPAGIRPTRARISPPMSPACAASRPPSASPQPRRHDSPTRWPGSCGTAVASPPATANPRCAGADSGRSPRKAARAQTDVRASMTPSAALPRTGPNRRPPRPLPLFLGRNTQMKRPGPGTAARPALFGPDPGPRMGNAAG